MVRACEADKPDPSTRLNVRGGLSGRSCSTEPDPLADSARFLDSTGNRGTFSRYPRGNYGHTTTKPDPTALYRIPSIAPRSYTATGWVAQ